MCYITHNSYCNFCGFSDEDDEKHEDWYAAMQEVLDHLSSVMTLEAFLSVLPSSAASSKPDSDEHDFQGHIQMCRKNQQAHQVCSLIIAIYLSPFNQIYLTSDMQSSINN